MKKAVLLSILVFVVSLAGGVVAETQQPARTQAFLDPIYDPAHKGKTYSALGGPFLIQVNDAFFRQSASYPRGETLAQGTFLFVDINIINNSDGPLQIPDFILEDSRGTKYLTAIRARRSGNALLRGESLNPGVDKRGYLIFDVPSLSGFESFPLRYKLLIDNSPHTIDVNVYKKMK
jgi:hypothetical protein